MLSKLGGAYTTYAANVETVMSNAGTSIEGFADVVEEETNNIKKKTEEAGKEIADLAKDGKTGYKGLVDAAKTWLDDYQDAVKPYLTENEKWVTSIGTIISKYSELD
jgi:phage-related protein